MSEVAPTTRREWIARALGVAMIGCIAVASIIGLVAIAVNDIHRGGEIWITCLLTVAGAFGGSLAGLWICAPSRGVIVAIIGICVIVFAWLGVVPFLVWAIGERDMNGRTQQKWISVGMIFLIAWMVSTFAGALLRAETKRGTLRLVRGAAIGFAVLFWTVASIGFISDAFLRFRPLRWMENLFGATLVLSAGAALLLGLVFRGMWAIDRQRQRSTRDTLGESVVVSMTCPWCEAPASFTAGPARCGACGTRMLIRLEEPRCECGYLIYQLQRDSCPECGREITNRAV